MPFHHFTAPRNVEQQRMPPQRPIPLRSSTLPSASPPRASKSTDRSSHLTFNACFNLRSASIISFFLSIFRFTFACTIAHLAHRSQYLQLEYSQLEALSFKMLRGPFSWTSQTLASVRSFSRYPDSPVREAKVIFEGLGQGSNPFLGNTCQYIPVPRKLERELVQSQCWTLVSDILRGGHLSELEGSYL
ncbi:hypothetical protein MMC13_004319 [Lambiella insularis]|nr:hypothetical protein [Lambiella insularis]